MEGEPISEKMKNITVSDAKQAIKNRNFIQIIYKEMT